MISILATLDGSQASLAVIPAIEKLAANVPVQVRLLQVVEPPAATPRRSSIARAPTAPAGGVPATPGSLSSPTSGRPAEQQWAESEEQAGERVMDEGREYLNSVAGALRDKGVSVETAVVLAGNVSEAIVEYVRRNSFDVIAMATHGRSGLSNLVQGSVASAVVRSGIAPVLLVRPVKDPA